MMIDEMAFGRTDYFFNYRGVSHENSEISVAGSTFNFYYNYVLLLHLRLIISFDLFQLCLIMRLFCSESCDN